MNKRKTERSREKINIPGNASLSDKEECEKKYCENGKQNKKVACLEKKQF